MQNTEHLVCPHIHQANGALKNRYLRDTDTKNLVCALPYSVTCNHTTVDSPHTRQNHGQDLQQTKFATTGSAYSPGTAHKMYITIRFYLETNILDDKLIESQGINV